MSTVSASFTYNVEDINNSVRRTNVLFRSVNSVRLTYRDLKQVMEKPTFVNIMWTLIQLSRTYNTLRRLHRLIIAETNIAAAVLGTIIDQPSTKPAPTSTPFSIQPLNIRVEAFRENLPMGLEGLDISNIPEKSLIMIQAILEEDAEITVADAKEILNSKLLTDPKYLTGTLEASIGWMPETFGTRIYANAFYAWWVEEGHHTFTGHHYLKGATERARLRLPEKIRTQIHGLLMDEIS